MAKPMQYCKVITITPIKINKFIFKKGKEKKKKNDMKDSYFYKMISTQRWASYYTAKCFYSLGQWEKYFMLWPLKEICYTNQHSL